MTRIPTLHLTCGLPGAGKTTLAKQIERDAPALRLTTDDWLTRLIKADPADHPDARIRDALEQLLLETAIRALELGIDVVLDFGVWSRAEREDVPCARSGCRRAQRAARARRPGR
jgi:predicted kinase